MTSPDLRANHIQGLTLFDNVVPAELGNSIRAQLLSAEPHHRSDIIIDSQRHPAPRLTSSFSDAPLRLDGMRASLPWSPEVAALRDAIGIRFGLSFNYALANLYRDGSDFTGWHRDKAELHHPGSTIAIVSFGATRTLSIRRRGSDAAATWPLVDSSVVLMTLGLQQSHEHAILAEPEDVGMRLSITLRHIRILPEYSMVTGDAVGVMA